ncbi:hypothetical protein N7517_008259 [Penicillium concentricum]|uniref:Conidiation protein Con-6 n=1 Tax=Penicillium concentricum TaxID=293559 RepID=A0A9W9RS19_9EURO|nr:uncharacterized protein N7517_008259 [Penicillium concentricum]KAJ5365373.1 hypothetical protein N7517_008259 [Penicillium concentricum]
MPREDNEMRGYKAAMSNRKVSPEAKQHAQDMLNELGGDQAREERYQAEAENKNPTRVSAGLKAAQHNPRVTEGGKQRASKKMEERGAPEE